MAVGRKAPPVIGAFDIIALESAGRKRRRAVRADIAKGKDFASTSAAQQHGLTAQHLPAHGAAPQRMAKASHVPEIGQE